jgi:hypothetical protein
VPGSTARGPVLVAPIGAGEKLVVQPVLHQSMVSAL